MVATESLEQARDANRQARDANREVELLKQDVQRLLMITEALWILVQRAHGYSEDDLRNLITEIDLRDGAAGGKDGAVVKCPACQRPISTRQKRCIYCGQAVEHNPFAR